MSSPVIAVSLIAHRFIMYLVQAVFFNMRAPSRLQVDYTHTGGHTRCSSTCGHHRASKWITHTQGDIHGVLQHAGTIVPPSGLHTHRGTYTVFFNMRAPSRLQVDYTHTGGHTRCSSTCGHHRASKWITHTQGDIHGVVQHAGTIVPPSGLHTHRGTYTVFFNRRAPSCLQVDYTHTGGHTRCCSTCGHHRASKWITHTQGDIHGVLQHAGTIAPPSGLHTHRGTYTVFFNMRAPSCLQVGYTHTGGHTRCSSTCGHHRASKWITHTQGDIHGVLQHAGTIVPPSGLHTHRGTYTVLFNMRAPSCLQVDYTHTGGHTRCSSTGGHHRASKWITHTQGDIHGVVQHAGTIVPPSGLHTHRGTYTVFFNMRAPSRLQVDYTHTGGHTRCSSTCGHHRASKWITHTQGDIHGVVQHAGTIVPPSGLHTHRGTYTVFFNMRAPSRLQVDYTHTGGHTRCSSTCGHHRASKWITHTQGDIHGVLQHAGTIVPPSGLHTHRGTYTVFFNMRAPSRLQVDYTHTGGHTRCSSTCGHHRASKWITHTQGDIHGVLQHAGTIVPPSGLHTHTGGHTRCSSTCGHHRASNWITHTQGDIHGVLQHAGTIVSPSGLHTHRGTYTVFFNMRAPSCLQVDYTHTGGHTRCPSTCGHHRASKWITHTQGDIHGVLQHAGTIVPPTGLHTHRGTYTVFFNMRAPSCLQVDYTQTGGHTRCSSTCGHHRASKWITHTQGTYTVFFNMRAPSCLEVDYTHTGGHTRCSSTCGHHRASKWFTHTQGDIHGVLQHAGTIVPPSGLHTHRGTYTVFFNMRAPSRLQVDYTHTGGHTRCPSTCEHHRASKWITHTHRGTYTVSFNMRAPSCLQLDYTHTGGHTRRSSTCGHHRVSKWITHTQGDIHGVLQHAGTVVPPSGLHTHRGTYTVFFNMRAPSCLQVDYTHTGGHTRCSSTCGHHRASKWITHTRRGTYTVSFNMRAPSCLQVDYTHTGGHTRCSSTCGHHRASKWITHTQGDIHGVLQHASTIVPPSGLHTHTGGHTRCPSTCGHHRASKWITHTQGDIHGVLQHAGTIVPPTGLHTHRGTYTAFFNMRAPSCLQVDYTHTGGHTRCSSTCGHRRASKWITHTQGDIHGVLQHAGTIVPPSGLHTHRGTYTVFFNMRAPSCLHKWITHTQGDIHGVLQHAGTIVSPSGLHTHRGTYAVFFNMRAPSCLQVDYTHTGGHTRCSSTCGHHRASKWITHTQGDIHGVLQHAGTIMPPSGLHTHRGTYTVFFNMRAPSCLQVDYTHTGGHTRCSSTCGHHRVSEWITHTQGDIHSVLQHAGTIVPPSGLHTQGDIHGVLQHAGTIAPPCGLHTHRGTYTVLFNMRAPSCLQVDYTHTGGHTRCSSTCGHHRVSKWITHTQGDIHGVLQHAGTIVPPSGLSPQSLATVEQ